ncbi:uncharacterized protein CIMG_08814 [Coccidioides immitis RS]|uniref:Uncharacterized protein n=1 Tax=Coccidioides immitis (strain RS) TaxID=246410 RepID=J3K695_COCIM|nr:uncharacterized protein CIMG_08814 [Coccidioides immitis RS]EAS30068.3 hypothetical protein CIMG_08814 [Coccidioides immitis RS]
MQYLWCLVLFFTVTVHSRKTTEPPPDTVRTLIGPLTTQFSAPSKCFEEIRTKRGIDLELGCEGPSGNECCPEGWASNRYFSPGMCPSGNRVCTLPTTRQRHETTVFCCPRYFDCPDNVEYPFCLSQLNTPTAVTTHTTGSTTRVQSEYLVFATPIQVRFQATDSSVVPIPTDSLNLPPPKKPLSKGAKAGIGIGVPVGMIGLAAAVVLFLRRRRRGSSDHVPLQSSMPDPPPAYSETK